MYPILLVLPLTSVFLAVAFAALAWKRQAAQATGPAALAFAFMVACALIDLNRAYLPKAVVVLAVPFQFAFLIAMGRALAARLEARLPWSEVWLLTGTAMAAHVWFFFGNDDLVVRIVISSLAFAMLIAIVAVAVARPARTFLDWLVVAALAFGAFVSLLRAVAGALQIGVPANAADWIGSPLMGWSYMIMVAWVAMLSLLLLLLIGRDLIDRHYRLTMIDPLTGLANRRALEEILSGEAASAHQAAMMLDLDHFKRVNDDHGHQAGDKVLVEVAKHLKSQIGNRGVLFRSGGEEFSLLLHGPDPDRFLPLAGALRRSVAQMSLPVMVTVSIGIAWRRPDEDLRSLLRRADVALYRAKSAGRDRVDCDPPQALDYAKLFAA